MILLLLKTLKPKTNGGEGRGGEGMGEGLAIRYTGGISEHPDNSTANHAVISLQIYNGKEQNFFYITIDCYIDSSESFDVTNVNDFIIFNWKL